MDNAKNDGKKYDTTACRLVLAKIEFFETDVDSCAHVQTFPPTPHDQNDYALALDH